MLKREMGSAHPANSPGRGRNDCVAPTGYLPAATRILTDRGNVPVAGVTVGDRVLTHTGRWQHVTDTSVTVSPQTVTVRGANGIGIQCAPAHEFYLRDSPDDDPAWRPAVNSAGRLWAVPVITSQAARCCDTQPTFTDEQHTWSPVAETTERHASIAVFAITVDEDQSCIAEGVVVRAGRAITPRRT